MIRQFFIVLVFVSIQVTSFAQDTLPKISVTYNGRTIISWVNPYTAVTSINIQKSSDSSKNFKTIGSVSDPGKERNSFTDTAPISLNMFYRLFISFNGGSYIYTHAYPSIKQTATKPVPELNKSSVTIKGIVIDSANLFLLGNVTVIVQETESNKEIKNTFSKEDGSFEVNNLVRKKYRLIISNVGYKTKNIDLPVYTNPVINLGKIAIASAAIKLKEVQVIKKKTLIEQDVDKLTYHAEADPESRLLTALDLLRKVPMITVDAEDNIQLNGSSNYLVLINGKTSSLFVRHPSDIFKGMPASTIKDIEVITNPPSKYEARGVGGIINLITYKKSIGGYNGSVNMVFSHPKGFAITSYVSAKTGKFSLSAYAGNNNYTNPVSTSNFFREDKVRKNYLQQLGENNSSYNSHNIGLEITYDIDSANVITANYTTNGSKGTNNFRQQIELINASGNVTEANTYLNSGSTKWNGNDVSLDYQRSFKNKDRSFSASYKLSTSDNTNPSDFIRRNITTNKSQESYTDNNSSSSEHTLQADYVQPFKDQIFEAGIKSVLSFNRSDYFYKNQDSTTGIFVLDTAQSDNFRYTENIYAAYASINLKKNNWGLKAGGRLEQTNVNATFRSSGTFAKQNYFNFLPSITLSRKLDETNVVRLSYGQRIERPILSYLNPYIYLVDPKNISYGNPNLHPTTSHVFNVLYNTFINSSSVSAGMFYIFTNNSIQQFTAIGSDLIARTTYGNIATNNIMGFSLSGNATLLKKLNINVNTTSSYVTFRSKFLNNPQTGFIFDMTAYSSYSFSKSWRASGNLGYSSSNILLQGRSAGYIWNSFSVFKDFLHDNRTTFSFSVSSPFQKNRRLFMELNDPAFHQLQESFVVIRKYSLSFNYRFAKVQ
jgi:Outer membrane receptor proteins, mostly Fe transport